MEDDDHSTVLSAEAAAALQAFYTEQRERQEMLDKIEADKKLADDIVFDENWQLSQFWYDDKTVEMLVKVIDKSIADGGRVALISCPTLFVPVKKQIGHRTTVTLFEYDERFEIHAPDFEFYDYKLPHILPPEALNSYDLIVADPPFLSEECMTKVAKTIELLAKAVDGRIVVCTGAVMKECVEKLLNLKQCAFQPSHLHNLANEFASYANFDLDNILKR